MTEEITSIRYLPEGQTLINNKVKVWLDDGQLRAEFDKNIIKEMDAIDLINVYINDRLELLDKVEG